MTGVLVNVVKACVRTESLRNLDAVCLLIILKEGRHHAWKSE
jgi:hypothetical protein